MGFFFAASCTISTTSKFKSPTMKAIFKHPQHKMTWRDLSEGEKESLQQLKSKLTIKCLINSQHTITFNLLSSSMLSSNPASPPKAINKCLQIMPKCFSWMWITMHTKTVFHFRERLICLTQYGMKDVQLGVALRNLIRGKYHASGDSICQKPRKLMSRHSQTVPERR